MQKIPTLFLITKLELGGAQKQLLSLINNLNKEKFQPYLFTAKHGLLLNDALAVKGLTVIKSRYLERIINPLKDLLALVEIYRFIKKHNFQIIHTHSSKAGILGRIAAKLAKTKIIIHTVHGWSFNNYQAYFKRISFIWLERFCARFTDKLIVVSHYDKQKGLQNKISQDNRYELIRYGIDYSEFNIKDETIRDELKLDSHLVIGMVSCLKPQKSPQDFIKLALLVKQRFPHIKFILIGDGILHKRIQQLITKFNLQHTVILTGWRQDIPRLLSAIEIFILTSLWEGLPVSVLEAMAANKPIVATNTGGIAEIVLEGKTGFLVPPGDMKKMSEKIFNLSADGRLRKKIGENAKNYLSSDFSLGDMVRNTQNLYESLIGKKERANAG